VRLKSLAEAREEARSLFKLHRAGQDPLVEERKAKAAAKAAAARGVTFSEAAAAYIAVKRAGWKNEKHASQWENTLATYAEPVIGDLACGAVTTEHVLEILRPLWDAKKVETGTRLRGRIENVLDYAKFRKWRAGENVARWKDHLKYELDPKTKVRKVKNFAAVPIDDLPGVYAKLGEAGGVAGKAAQFCILTASRPGNVAKGKLEQVEFETATWEIPAEEMKRDLPHRVPLSKAALAILRDVARPEGNPYLFPSPTTGEALSLNSLSDALEAAGGGEATMHGTARSTFDDWCTERTSYPSKLVDRALAHKEKNATVAAYRRTDLLEQRRPLMEHWAKFLKSPPVTNGKVVPMRQRA
jgi:integrase